MEATGERSLLVITGSMGSGKSAVMAEASDILASRGVPHAAIDLDGLGLAHLRGGGSTEEVMYRNLAAVWRNYAALGISRLLLARAVEDRAELQRCISSVGIESIVVCRLTAPIGTMQRRVASRELGMHRDKYVERVVSLNAQLDGARLEHFAVANDNRPLTEVAEEMLQCAGWL